MEFLVKHGLRAMTAVFILCGMALGYSDPTQITVLVNDSAGVPSAVLKQAEAEAARVFRIAGIDITWLNCVGENSDELCRVVPTADEFVLHIVPDGKTSSEWVFGEAFLGEGGEGKYIDIFFNRVRKADGILSIDMGRLLGAVSAHELGHLLLGSHAHSQVGIMEPIWEDRSMREIGRGTLVFTKDQSQKMKARVGGQTLSVSVQRPFNY
jgi:hypothetical protein